MSINFNQDNSVQLTGTYTTSSLGENVQAFTKSGNNIYNTALGNAGIGTTAITTYKLNVNGSLNSTSLYQNGTLIDFTTYATNTALTNGLASKENVLTFSAPLTRTTNTIGINLGSYSQTGADANYIKITGGTISSGTLSFGTRILDNLIQLYSNTYYIGINAAVFRFNADTGASYKFYFAATNPITFTAAGNISATSFTGSGAALTSIPYAALTGTPVVYTQSQTDTAISTANTNTSNYASNISNVLLRNSSNYASNISNVIITNSSNYASNISNVIITNSSNYASNISNVLLINSSNYASNISNVLLINRNTLITNTSNYASNISNVIATNYYNKTATDTLLNAKQNTLTFTSPLVNTTNTITFNESSITTLTNFYNKTASDARYLQLTGGTLTGDLLISKTSPILTIKSSFENQNSILYLSTPYTSTSALKTAIISEGIWSWSRSKLHFCLNNTGDATAPIPDWNAATYSATVADAKLTILPSGKIGIGNTSPSQILQIGAGGRLRIANDETEYSIIGSKDTDDGLNTRIVVSGSSRGGGNTGNIEYCATSVGSHIFKTTSGGYEKMRIDMDGNVITKGYIYAGETGANGGLRISGTDPYITFYQEKTLLGTFPANISFNLRNDNNFKFLSTSTTSPFNTSTIMQMNTTSAQFNVPILAPVHNCTGEDYSFIVNWNGTGASGWFIGLNRFWSTGHYCLHVSILALNAGGLQQVCWFGRVYCSYVNGSGTGTPPATEGGIIQITTELRYPTVWTPTNYYMTVTEQWDGSGNNTLFVYVSNPNYAGTLRVKIK